MNAKYNDQILEWIPYDRFKNIEYLDKREFGIIYKANWLDGPIECWNNDERRFIRKNNMTVSLKSLNKSLNSSEEFLNEV